MSDKINRCETVGSAKCGWIHCPSGYRGVHYHPIRETEDESGQIKRHTDERKVMPQPRS